MIQITAITPKRGDLGLTCTPENLDDAELSANSDRSIEESFDLIGFRRGRHIVVLRLSLEQQVPNATAGEERFMAGGSKAGNHRLGLLSSSECHDRC